MASQISTNRFSPKGKQPRDKYVTKACQECRRRRARCDGKFPSCTRCSKKRIPCQYSTEETRRQPAPKSYVLMLRDRVRLLERVIQMHGIDLDASVSALSAEQGSGDGNANDEDYLCDRFDGVLTLDDSLNFDQDGEMHFFGATSGRLKFQPSSQPEAYPHHHDDQMSLEAKGRPNIFCQAMLEEDDVDPSLKSHLIDLYFTWEQPWLQVVNERLFRTSMDNDGPYFSHLLLNCILAIASRYTNRLDVRSDPDDPNTAGKVFLEKAEVLLHYELKRPNILTIQSLAIMGLVYVAMGSDAAGWLHHGMAVRLALDMGLNVDPTILRGQSSMSADEIDLRRNIYWALYCHDKLSASYTGRICTLLDVQGVVNLPTWTDGGEPPITFILHKALIGLCQILEKVLLSFWAPKSSILDSQKHAIFQSCLLDLKSWMYDLPSILRITKPNNCPHAYTLHMVYYTIHTLLVKPFLKHSPDNSNIKKANPNHIAIEAAQNICLVAQSYRQVYGSFHSSVLSATHCTLSAALIFIEEDFTERSGGRPCMSTRKGVEACLTVLGELSYSWNPAGRIYKSLSILYRGRETEDDISNDQTGNLLCEDNEIALDGDSGLAYIDSSFLLSDMGWFDGLPGDMDLNTIPDLGI